MAPMTAAKPASANIKIIAAGIDPSAQLQPGDTSAKAVMNVANLRGMNSSSKWVQISIPGSDLLSRAGGESNKKY